MHHSCYTTNAADCHEFLNSAYDAEMTSSFLLVAVDQDHYCWASSSFVIMTDQPAPIFVTNCNPPKTKSCSTSSKERDDDSQVQWDAYSLL